MARGYAMLRISDRNYLFSINIL